jgi:uncharacterized membrane-anchored protein YhcB (DUF1043 family)
MPDLKAAQQKLAQQNLRDELRKMGEQERDEIIIELCDHFNLTADTIAKIPQEIESLESDLAEAKRALETARGQVKTMKEIINRVHEESGLWVKDAGQCS